MSRTSQLKYRRTHNLLLISKLLNGRDHVSPFTLVIDSLEQSGKPIVQEITQRAKLAKTQIVFISFETLRRPKDADAFIAASRLPLADLQKQTSLHMTSTSQKTIFILDSVNALAAQTPNLPAMLSALISPTTYLVATYHSDIVRTSNTSPYAPDDLTVLNYLATTIMTAHSLSHLLAEKAARDRSLPSPVFGLQSETEGVVSSVGSNDPRGVVIEMEYRRKSGRGVCEWFFLPAAGAALPAPPRAAKTPACKERVILLEDHPLFRVSEESSTQDDESMDTTFNLGLTEKQRRDREGVVLPYFDAQKDEGVGEGGRILYDMGSEDDFDDEEDEI